MATFPSLAKSSAKAAGKARVKPRGGLVTALDIGSTKICCFIARLDEQRGGRLARVVGIGHQAARGIRNGAVVDLEAAEASIRAAVSAAEQMAATTVQGVILNVSAGHPTSRMIGVEVSIAGQQIADSDMRRALGQTRMADEADERELIHSIPIGFSIDGSRGIRDPRGMFGERLGVNMHLISAQAGALRNLQACVARCHLEIDAMVVSPYAAGLASLVEDEMDLGATVIDMGGGTTSIAVFFDGNVVFTDTISVGGGHVTSDIARGLSTPLVQAERIKTLHGSALSSPADDREAIEVPLVGEDDSGAVTQIPKSLLVGIIHPRVEETLEMVRSRLEASGFDRLAGRRAVVTGGASQLPGARELAARILDKQVRIGRPLRLGGLAEATSGPAFATCAGLVGFAGRREAETTPAALGLHPEQASGFIGRIGEWFRAAF
ncbi:MAG: cell division protein FtsA [Pseudoxanthomonas mexicana]|nr:cell division protein FtsA [Pseudoxanthomonas mexicana]